MSVPARHVLAAVVAALVVLAPAALAADPVEDFYKGRQIRIVTGANAGDGYDLWSRFLARHIGRHIPGRPTIIVQNMPGAGTLIAANYIFNVAARDGTIMGSFSRSLPSQAVLNRPNIRFDPRQFGWIGSPETINRVCAVGAATEAKTIDDVFTQEVLVGGMGASMVPTYMPTLLNKLVGTKFRVVEGYGSTNAIFLAIERREVDGVCMASSTLLGPRVDLLESGALKVLFNMEAKTMAALPGVPTMFARLKTEEHRQIVSFINSALEFGRPFTAPPGVPHERLAALQAALRATVDDPEFLAEAKQLKFQITYTSPDELRELTERMYATPRAIIEEAAAMMPTE
jgi:tripartite-type tricarboxylate transporter receptor subunit TctC